MPMNPTSAVGTAATDPPGRIAVVTGSRGLIGSAVCTRLRRDHVTTIGMDVGYGRATPYDDCDLSADVGDEDVTRHAFGEVARRYGRLDWLVHAAALTGESSPIDLSGPVSAVDLAAWREIVAVNVTGALVCVQAALGLLKKSENARIVLIGSIQGLVPTIDSGAYSVSKAALTGLTSQLAVELASVGITVNMISPGTTVRTSSVANPAESPNPMGRFCSADEMAESVVSVLTVRSNFMTGAVIPVDGGEHLRPRRGPKRPG